jgi:hypothetical protein
MNLSPRNIELEKYSTLIIRGIIKVSCPSLNEIKKGAASKQAPALLFSVS